MSKRIFTRVCFICDDVVPNKQFDEHFDTHAEELDGLKYSNDAKDYCQTACLICGKEMYLMRMRAHTKEKHGIGITDYKTKFQLQGFHIISKVFHKCGICSEIMLFDADTINTHVAKHDITHKAYNETFLNMINNRLSSGGEIKRPKSVKIKQESRKYEPPVVEETFISDDIQSMFSSIYNLGHFDLRENETMPGAGRTISHEEMHLAEWSHECSDELEMMNYYFEIQ